MRAGEIRCDFSRAKDCAMNAHFFRSQSSSGVLAYPGQWNILPPLKGTGGGPGRLLPPSPPLSQNGPFVKDQKTRLPVFDRSGQRQQLEGSEKTLRLESHRSVKLPKIIPQISGLRNP